MDAATTALVIGYTKNVDIVDKNTIDADSAGSRALCLVDISKLDADGNILTEIVFLNTTFG